MKARTRHGVRGEHVAYRTSSPAQYDAGRTCSTCSVPLSRYNAGPGCYAHTESKPVMLRAGRRKVGVA